MRANVLEFFKIVRYAYGYLSAPVLLLVQTGNVCAGALFIGRHPLLSIRGEMTIGPRFRMRAVTRRTMISTGRGGRVDIGADVFINQGVTIHSERSITLGDRIEIGDSVRIYDTNFHAQRPGGETKVAPVVIEDDVWIGSGATVLPGVTIGRGSVVGAGTVVARSIDAGTVLVPAQPRVAVVNEIPEDYRRR